MAKKRKDRRKKNLYRENIPGSLEHASGDIDEAEAAIVAGSDGQAKPIESGEGLEHPEELSTEDFAAVEDSLDQIEEDMEAGKRQEVADEELALVEETEKMKPAATKEGVVRRTLTFLRSSWGELQRVQWPDRRQVGQATAVVLGFVVLAGLYLGLADLGAQELVGWII